MSEPTKTDREVINLHATELPELGNDLKLLAVPLTADEWAERATASAMLGGEIDGLNEDLKAFRDQIRAEVKTLQDERDRADKAVRDRAEDRPVGVRLLADLEQGLGLVVRVDTGEIIERRSLTEQEVARASQRVLSFPG